MEYQENFTQIHPGTYRIRAIKSYSRPIQCDDNSDLEWVSHPFLPENHGLKHGMVTFILAG